MKTGFKETEYNLTMQKLFTKKNQKNNFLILILLLGSIFINGQSSPDFTILVDKAFQKLYQDPDDCISYSQSLQISDPNIEHKIVFQNIISRAYVMKGDYVQSVNILNGREDPAERPGLSHFMQIYSDYNLADQYQNLGLYNQSKRVIIRLLSQNKLFKSDDPKVKITLVKLYQLQAVNFKINRDYVTALKNLDKSDEYISSHNEEYKIIEFENKIFRASCLMKQNKSEESKKLLESVIYNTETQNKPFLLALAYGNLSQYYFLKGDYDASIKKLEKGLSKIENLPYNELKRKIYESLTKNYFALHNDEKYHYYNNLYTALNAKLEYNKKEGVRYIVKLFEFYQNKKVEFENQNELKKTWILIAVISFVIINGLIIYFIFETRRNRDLKKQFTFFKKQEKIEGNIHKDQNILLEKRTLEHKNTDKDSNKISKEKEDEILRKLEEWELANRYLNQNMSLSLLSTQMAVNTKYLSEVINNHKGKNFNGYINELRISHIVHLLKTDSRYLNYKVSYLAEYLGFSSHSAFTNIFKSLTGMSPNTYIQEIIKGKIS